MKIGFLGAGNMGGAILRAVSENPMFQCMVYDKCAEKMQEIAELGTVHTANSVQELMQFAEAVLIAVKPVHIAALLQDLKACGGYAGKIYITIAAGVKIQTYTEVLGEVPLVRTMPNLPAMVGEGFTGIYYHHMDGSAFVKSRQAIQMIFGAFGKTIVLQSEGAIDKLISVTSSSPAYICLLIDALADGAVRAGFSREDAYVMAEQTVYGTAKYLLETKTLPSVLKDRVCSPAGTTIEAVASLERNGFRSAVLEAMQACERKAEGRT